MTRILLFQYYKIHHNNSDILGIDINHRDCIAKEK